MSCFDNWQRIPGIPRLECDPDDVALGSGAQVEEGLLVRVGLLHLRSACLNLIWWISTYAELVWLGGL